MVGVYGPRKISLCSSKKKNTSKIRDEISTSVKPGHISYCSLKVPAYSPMITAERAYSNSIRSQFAFMFDFNILSVHENPQSCHQINDFNLLGFVLRALTFSQTNPCFYVSAVQFL